MYIWTRDRLGQSQPTRFTLQTFNRPTAQPTPIGYLGNFNEHKKIVSPAYCETFDSVDSFGPGSDKLLSPIEQKISDIALNIAVTLKDRLPQKQQGKVRDFELLMRFTGHVDKSTDPKQYGDLDWRRADAVAAVLQNEITRVQYTKLFFNKLDGMVIKTELNKAGPSFPLKSTAAKNRRVDVCVGWNLRDR
jgi:hypothetical protein